MLHSNRRLNQTSELVPLCLLLWMGNKRLWRQPGEGTAPRDHLVLLFISQGGMRDTDVEENEVQTRAWRLVAIL